MRDWNWYMCTTINKIGFPDGSVIKNPPANAGDRSSIPGLGRSIGEGNDNSLKYSCLENPHGQRSLAGYSPRVPKSQAQLSKHSTAYTFMYVCVLSATPWTISHQAPLSMGILQARILDWVAMSFSRRSF